jgi:sialic acid synthase SpsE
VSDDETARALRQRAVGLPGDFPGEFELDGRVVGGGNAPWVIAEVGANHNRDLDLAHKLIDAARDAGADAVKFQTYSGNRIYSSKAPRFKYLESVTDKSPAELLEEISLPREWQPELAAHAREAGLSFFSSPFDEEAVDELTELGVPVLKIASFEIVDHVLIERAAASGKPLLISTGMATLGEIEEALAAAQRGGAREIGLMQCTSVYPAPDERTNLRAMETMRRAFGVPVGFSDHTTGTAVPIAAAALGAAFVEKHFTLDRTMRGPDHPFALEPEEFSTMTAGIAAAFAALGNGRKQGPSPEEADEMYLLARRSLVAAQPLVRGTRIERSMVVVKRPGYGIAPKHLELVLGRELSVDVEADEIITWDMF